MKRELAFALEARSQILDSVGKTRSNRVPSFDTNATRTSKRVKRTTLHDLLQLDCSVAEIKESSQKIARPPEEDFKDQTSANSDPEISGIELGKRDIVLALPRRSGESLNLYTNNVGHSSVLKDGRGLVYGLAGSLPQDNNGRLEEAKELKTPHCLGKKEKPAEASGELKILAVLPASRRFTRSLLKSNNKDNDHISSMENNTSEVKTVDNAVDSHQVENPDVHTPKTILDEQGCAGANLLETPTKQLEIDCFENFAINKMPRTVRELLETGLFEGYPVYYNGGKEGPLIHGLIKGIGILCSCGSCKGGRIVAPSRFEQHAIKSYKKAAEKICFNNGKSFIEILHICRKAELNTLLVTIQQAIGPLPEKQESFPTTILANVEPLCDSCTPNLIYSGSPIRKGGRKSRSSKISSTFKSGASAPTQLRSINGGTDRPEKEFFMQKYTRRTQMEEVSPKKSCDKKRRHTLEDAVLTPKSSTSPSAEVIERSRKPIRTPKSSKVSSLTGSSHKKAGKITTKDFHRNRAVFDKLADGTELAYYAHGERLLNGYKQGTGIFCYCCNNVVSASQFEAHAGYATHKKPYEYIYTSDGISLHDLALSICIENGRPDKKSDDLCFICAEGDSLLLCDGCPRAFHRECAALTCEPSERWYCRYCQSLFERGKHGKKSANAIAAGSTRTLKDTDEFTACHLCSGSDFERSVFGPRTILLCDQCEKEYHISCLKEHSIADLRELPQGTWFCSEPCQEIHTSLQALLCEGTQKLPRSFLDAIIKKNVDSVDAADLSWLLLSGQLLREDSKKATTKELFSQAIAVLHEGFGYIMTHGGGRDLIPQIVYGRDLNGSQDYTGMYCAVLLIKDVIVSVAVFRVFGQEIMELPLVATREPYRGKGYFQALFGCIERFLSVHRVKSIVLPAAEEAEAIWLKLGLKRMTSEQYSAYKKVYWKMVEFNGIVWLEKEVPKLQPANPEQLYSEEAGTSQSLLPLQIDPKLQPVEIEKSNPEEAGSSKIQPEAQSCTGFQSADVEQPDLDAGRPISISAGGP